jgi:diguanylate cyclase (GGDEF)-like protein
MKESTKKLQNKAEIDELTQLPNRSKIVSLVNEYIINMEEGKLAAFIILDLDNFKMVNDTYGHMAGDTVLKEIGAHIRKKIKAADYIGRLGGDEFIVLLKDFKNEEDLYAKCKRLNELFSLDFTFNGVTFTQRCSIGVTIINKKDTNFDELYELSDKALYNSKKIGKANYTIAE